MNLTCLKTMFLQRNKHVVSIMKANQLKLYKEIVVVVNVKTNGL